MSCTITKTSYTNALRDKTPEQWAWLLNSNIDNPQLRAWVASIAMWNYPKSKGFPYVLGNLSDCYSSMFNANGSAELEAALLSVGLPYHPSKNDNSKASERKNSLGQGAITTKQRKGNENAQKCVNWNRSEAIRNG